MKIEIKELGNTLGTVEREYNLRVVLTTKDRIVVIGELGLSIKDGDQEPRYYRFPDLQERK
jgi:hypothetical protein